MAQSEELADWAIFSFPVYCEKLGRRPIGSRRHDPDTPDAIRRKTRSHGVVQSPVHAAFLSTDDALGHTLANGVGANGVSGRFGRGSSISAAAGRSARADGVVRSRRSL